VYSSNQKNNSPSRYIYKGRNSNHYADLEAFRNSNHSASKRWSSEIKYMLTNNQMLHYRNIHDIATDKINIGAKNNIY